jgi:hypothetical protein
MLGISTDGERTHDGPEWLLKRLEGLRLHTFSAWIAVFETELRVRPSPLLALVMTLPKGSS